MTESVNHIKNNWQNIYPGVLSLLIPGLGQLIRKRYQRGIGIFFLVVTAIATVTWFKDPHWYIIVGLLWAWNILDAIRLPRGSPIFMAVLLWLIMAYGIGSQVTQFDLGALSKNRERSAAILKPMLHPSIIEPSTERREGWVDMQVPCSSLPPKPDRTSDGVRVNITPDCANVGETITVTGEGFWPNYPVTLQWTDAIGTTSGVWSGITDNQGKAVFELVIPPAVMRNASDPSLPQLHRPTIYQSKDIGGYHLSKTGKYTLRGILETIALALLATTIGALLAIPISFIAARNLMGGNLFTRVVYFIVRTILNFFRSIEALILAIIFVVIVGLGPFPGMLAITVHTVAALGKLFSEVIEGIDPGPIEAIRATGANWMQIVRYAVIPQIVPPFTALTIYRWDINVRSSTIIGFVGGGGIGFYLYQWILMGDYRSVSSAFIAIAIVVITMDFFSAKLRERIR